MNASLKSLSISDFRSISGTITVPLDAPIVLLHGPNGAGKTSVLSALELALTGDVPSMHRIDPSYRSHLIHRGSDKGRIVLESSGLLPKDSPAHENQLTFSDISGGSLLSGDLARFFSERCYLAQSTLGRLLEIYQDASSRKESALTHFVKDLLGLDALDALIDGLQPAGDMRNSKHVATKYSEADAAIKSLDKRILDLEGKLKNALLEQDAQNAKVRASLIKLAIPHEQRADAVFANDLEQQLNSNDDEERLVSLKNIRRDIESLRKRAAPLSQSRAAHDEAVLQNEEELARNEAASWRTTTGKDIEEIIAQLRNLFPDLPSVASTDPAMAFQTVTTRVDAEVERCQRTIKSDDALIVEVNKLTQSIEQSQARIALADEQLALIMGESAELGKALTAIIPHIHDDVCPVCARNYNEYSKQPLVQYVASQVSSLAAQADRLKGLGESRAIAVVEQSASQRNREAALSRRIGQDERAILKERIAKLSLVKGKLSALGPAVKNGGAMLRREVIAQKAVSEFRSRERLSAEIRLALNELCKELKQPLPESSEAPSSILERLEVFTKAQEADATDRVRLRRLSIADYSLFRSKAIDVSALRKDIADNRSRKQIWDDAFQKAEKNRQGAKALGKAAASARTAIVGRVFNSSLNKIWRDLFVRLAPTEPFVPAFKLPQNALEAVTAQLETVHREGGTGGAPGSMLSAGNLNTAALTLFIALHLSVEPQLPWLILDDPVQSMDEVHISQLAALLRTLSKEHSRRVIIAVHERPLFEYLALELSPAFPGDQLVTIELSRTNAGSSLAEPTFYDWEPDRGISVA